MSFNAHTFKPVLTFSGFLEASVMGMPNSPSNATRFRFSTCLQSHGRISSFTYICENCYNDRKQQRDADEVVGNLKGRPLDSPSPESQENEDTVNRPQNTGNDESMPSLLADGSHVCDKSLLW